MLNCWWYSQITRRYAEFSAAIIGLNESFPSERVNELMSQLLNEVENFILRMAAEFPQRREQLVFLINNYDMMLAVIVVSHFSLWSVSLFSHVQYISRVYGSSSSMKVIGPR